MAKKSLQKLAVDSGTTPTWVREGGRGKGKPFPEGRKEGYGEQSSILNHPATGAGGIYGENHGSDKKL